MPGQVARLVTIDQDGNDLKTIYETDQSIIEAPNWSPDGKWLVFNGSGSLWQVPVDGSAPPEAIPTGDVQGINNDHILAPDGKTIYFSAKGHVYAVPFKGGSPRRVSNEPPADNPFTYWLHGISPDGTKLVYTGARKIGDDPWAEVDIYTIPSEGGLDVNVTNSPHYDDGPEYSPDGRWIYFNSERAATQPGHAQIFRMKPDGSSIEQLTHDDRVNWFPHLSPDGRWLVYLSFPPGTVGHPSNKDVILRKMSPDGGRPTNLIAFNGGQGTINVPSWSPDGRRFAFVMYPIAETATNGETKARDNSGGASQRLRVSENKRFLVDSNGKPFFWLGDTAWELFHRLNREEATQYLVNRAKLGFTVIQAVALAELNGLNDPNPYGHKPLLDHDPTKPDVKEGPNNDYWDHVDFIIDKANSLGLTIGFLPSWGDKWTKMWGVGPEIFTSQNAAVYGEWIGHRYKDKNIVWIVGGDRPIENETNRAIIIAMAQGLRKADGGKHLITYHPTGKTSSSQYFHDASWLDFNMRQNGHFPEFTNRYSETLTDYRREPAKPVLDGEPIYEDHPISFKAAELGHSLAADVRRPLYWDLFSGAFGHTYGHHSVWQMWSEGKEPINAPLMPWFEAIHQPGAAQMQHARALLESRPFLTRIPDDSVIVTARVSTSLPGAGRYRFVATRDQGGSYAMVYAPIGRAFKVRMDAIGGSIVNAWWFNPRDGSSTKIGEFSNTGQREFTPPDQGETIDWVLVLDDASMNFNTPGQRW